MSLLHRLSIAASICLVINTSAIAADYVNWSSYGLDPSERRFSELKQINTKNVGALGLAWHLDLPGMSSLVSTPLAIDGVIYFSGSHSVVHAVDAQSGKVLWRYDPKTMLEAGENAKIIWDTNRGLAHWEDRIFVASGDGRLIALEMATGKELWSTRTVDRSTPRSVTGAPRAFNDLVIIGHGGADLGPVRGYVTAYDVRTGEQRWRFHTVPGNPADGFENDAMKMAAETWTGEWWKHGGGGTVWNAMTYDPEYNRIYLGTGNGAPWNRKIRSPEGGDNLFLCSVVALDADTGEYVWHYQTSPGETWDFNSAMDMVLTELNIGGKQRKVLMHAPKNGFFYILDREDGKLLSADAFGKVTWATHVDMETGKPVEADNARYLAKDTLVWPGPLGAHNWHPMSYNPSTGLVYIPYQELPGYYNDAGINQHSWRSTAFTPSLGIGGFEEGIPAAAGWSALKAWDPVNSRVMWQIRTPGLWNPGTLTTAGNLLFQGRADGVFLAYDAATGETLWKFNAGVGISAPPITFAIDGTQYIALLVGWGGAAATLTGELATQHGWEYGAHPRRLLVFKLDADAVLPTTPPPMWAAPIDNPLMKLEPELVQTGGGLFRAHCAWCHGGGASGGGATPDLRASPIALDSDAFRATVRHGRLARGMPAFDKDLSKEDLDALEVFIRHAAREHKKTYSAKK